jgi:23S rRNA pseudouridine1911/1915/1917 synthase
MVKVSSSDIVHILRRFEVAHDETVPRNIEQIKIAHPHEHTTLVSFRFNKQRFYILFDDMAEDETSYVLKQIQSDKQDVTGEILQNPTDAITTYAIPFKGKDVYLFEVSSRKKRLDVLLAERYPEYSRSTWQKYIKAGHVTVNGTTQTSPKYDATDADLIAVSIPEATDFSAHTLPILYLDDDVIVINKPVGILTHAKGALNDEFTVADFFRRYTTFGLETNRPGIVHRLDRDTSGVMIGARNPETATLLQKQFADRKTKKTYIAVLAGIPKESKAKIDLPIGRNPSAPSTFRVDAKGKSATTEYEVLASNSQHQSLVMLSPFTGRTHQLRVHMAYINTPILGDRVYGKSANRLYLHAYTLEVTLPTHERKIFTATLPDEFTKNFPVTGNLLV